MACSATNSEARSEIGTAYSAWPAITTAEIVYALPPWYLYYIGVQETNFLGYGPKDNPSSSNGWGLFQQTSTVSVQLPGALHPLPNEPCKTIGQSCGTSSSNAAQTHYTYRPLLCAMVAARQLKTYYNEAVANRLSGNNAWEWAACRYNGSESGYTPSCEYGSCVMGYLSYVQTNGVPFNGTTLSGTEYPSQR
jgi:hypothetical protein